LNNDSKAITKIQGIILVTTIVVASIAGAAASNLLSGPTQLETIKIGVLASLGTPGGKAALQGATLAAEQINDQGGILGKQVEVVGEDTQLDKEIDLTKVNNALLKLISVHKVDFVLAAMGSEAALMCQDISSEHEKIMLGIWSPEDVLTERLLDNYDKYKYFFRVAPVNQTIMFQGLPFCTAGLREYTGFNKVGYLGTDLLWNKGIRDGLDYVLPEIYGFELVYRGTFPTGTKDFTSYFSAAESAGVEILITLIATQYGTPVVIEWHDRQSPMVLWGINNVALSSDFWEATGGKCEYASFVGSLPPEDFPITNETLPYSEAYRERWEDDPFIGEAIAAFNAVRFILCDALIRAKTTETDAVIKALEETSIATVSTPNLRFTSNHDILVTKLWDPETGNNAVIQWQNGELVPVYPPEFMEEVGASYLYPDWPGPWD